MEQGILNLLSHSILYEINTWSEINTPRLYFSSGYIFSQWEFFSFWRRLESAIDIRFESVVESLITVLSDRYLCQTSF